MNSPVRRLLLFIMAMACIIVARESGAQTISSNAVGYVQLTCTAASDTTLAVPFTQPAATVGLIALVSGSTVTVSGTAGWTSNQFVYSGSGSSTYYVQLGPCGSGTDPKDGSYYTIASNGANTLTLELNGDDISSVPAGCTLTVYPYWTLATVFPPSTSGTSFIASTSPLFRQTQILVPNASGAGINLATAATYYFYNGAWRLAGDSVSNSHNDDILIPDSYVTVRNPSGTTTLMTKGNVQSGNFTIPLATEASGAQDNFVGICRPIDTSLNDLALATSGAFTSSTSGQTLQDQILLISNTTAAINKSASATYFYYTGTSGTGWRLFGDSITNDHGGDLIPAGTGFVIRKAATAGGATEFWQNPPTY